jgi:hypothetical protein
MVFLNRLLAGAGAANDTESITAGLVMALDACVRIPQAEVVFHAPDQ